MLFRLPVRRFVHCTDKIDSPTTRVGSPQWVLSRPLYRFRRFNLAQVPAKNRDQALRLELGQWTPFARSDYYVSWHAEHALVWGWDADRVVQAQRSKGLKPTRALPETVLHSPQPDGLALVTCIEGCEGQLWRQGKLEHSRWWAQPPSAEEWLMFQRDAAIASAQQQAAPVAAQGAVLNATPWVNESRGVSTSGLQLERLAYALGVLALSTPTLWYAASMVKLQQGTAALREQQNQLQAEAEPLLQARSEALAYQARAATLTALDRYPNQLELMAKVAQALPKDKSFVKEWDFQAGQLKVTVSAPNDLSTTAMIGLLERAGPFRSVKALPGRDTKNVTFQMEVTGA